MENLLLGGYMPFKPLGKPQLVESATGSGQKVLRVEGVFQNYKVINENGRRYGKNVWDQVFNEGNDFQNRLKDRAVLGMIEHPEDGLTKLDEVSHVIVEARYATPKEIGSNPDLEEGDIIGAYETLPTPKGKIVEALLMAGVKFGVSSRGNGTVSESSDCLEVNEDFQLETWDVVFSPSVTRAIPRIQAESDLGKRVNIIKETIDAKEFEEEEKPMKDEKVQESSFVLATGIMNKGEQLIPIQLIAESNKFCWYNGNDNTPLTEFHQPFISQVAALKAMNTFCESKGYEYDFPFKLENEPVPVSGTVTESHDDMNTRSKLTKVQTDVIRLRKTDISDLKPIEKIGFFEAVNDYRVEIGRILEEDASLKLVAEKSLKLLEEFEDDLNDEGGEEEIDGPSVEPELDAGPEDMPEEEGGEEDIAQVADILDQAAEKLEQACEEDPECEQLASELRDISNDICPEDECDIDPEMGPEDNFDDEIDDKMPMESRRKILRSLREAKRVKSNKIQTRTERQLNLLQARYEKLAEASSNMLAKYKELKESIVDGNVEGPEGLVERSQRFEEAAKELAGKYNKDMKEMGMAYIQLRRPDLWESYGEKLANCKTFDKFTEMSKHLVSENPDPALEGDDEEEISTVESKKGKKGKTLTESADKGKTGKNSGEEDLKESVHPALSMVSRARTKGSKFAV